ncbi:MAG: hypothetical protein ABR520_09170 [Mycobacteriales bacterium]|nr:hypothetical protein [Frankia sp.]
MASIIMLLTSLLATDHSLATTKVCRLVTDPVGDETNRLKADGRDPSLDLVSADVATDRKHLTVVLRLRKLSPPLSGDVTGQAFWLFFSVHETRFVVWAPVYPSGPADAHVSIAAGGADPGAVSVSAGTRIGSGTTTLDEVHNEVRMSTSLATFQNYEPITPGTRLYQLLAWSHVEVGVRDGLPGFTDDVDRAISTRAYRAGDPSCVRVGR